LWRLRALHELGTIDLLDHAGVERLLLARHSAEQLGVHGTAVVLDIQLSAAYNLQFAVDEALAYANRAAELSGRLRLGRTHSVSRVFEACAHALRGDRDAMRHAEALALREAPGDSEIDGMVTAGAAGV